MGLLSKAWAISARAASVAMPSIPVGLADPVADLIGFTVFLRVEADATDKLAVFLDGEGKAPAFDAGALVARDPLFGKTVAIWMGHASQHARHFPVADKFAHARRVVEGERPKNQPVCFQNILHRGTP